MGPEVHEQMFGTCVQPDAKPPVFSFKAILGQTLNSDIYCQRLYRLKLVTDQKRPELAIRSGVVFRSGVRATPHDIIIPREFLSDKSRCVQFETAFVEEVHSSKILAEFFDFSQISSLDFSRIMEPYISSVLKAYNISNPIQLAHSCVEPIPQFQKPLAMPVLARIYGNTFAKITFLAGILDQDNAVSMALIFANTLQECIQQYESSDPEWKFKVLIKGCADFTESVHINSKDFAPLSILIYANEWKLINSL
ncbi:hypothetical protein TNCV_190231 [Trichonephila clavipes]|nr:hypothetical protein TNCV_190231 [Trichonephila clavipes]